MFPNHYIIKLAVMVGAFYIPLPALAPAVVDPGFNLLGEAADGVVDPGRFQAGVNLGHMVQLPAASSTPANSLSSRSRG